MSAPAGPLSPRDNTRHGMRFAPGVFGAVHPVLSSGSGWQWSETRERNREKGWIIDRKKNREREAKSDMAERYREKSGPLWPDTEIMLTGPIQMESRFPGVDRRVKNDPRVARTHKVIISVEQISCDYKLMKHNDEEDENLRDVGDEEVATAGANNTTTVVKMPIADSTRDIRYMSPQADSRRMAWSRKQRGAGEIDLSARWRSGGKPAANPTRKSQRAQLRVSQSKSIDL
ncbi:hypothetical protein G5I_03273 [Acromyrmex echinatior]|uniref:Uncharacterized protein n=1 Tax=Acromyrmex echinatior TaxID=103372 RepID=F4WCJ7_ACREC|nr:hypothetical protein G5I_03273 [Acromyrmex echinatior]